MPRKLPTTRLLRRAFVASQLALLCAVAAPVAAADASSVPRYDASRNAAGDVDRALASAKDSGKPVLIAVGGDWCKDCRELDALYSADPSLAALRDERYVGVKIFVGSENRNETVLSRFPRIDWVPTLIELDPSGKVVRFAPTTEFLAGDRLDADKLRAFLAAPRKKGM